MIAMTAFFATCWPKVGPTEVESKLALPFEPERAVQKRLDPVGLIRRDLRLDLDHVVAEVRVRRRLDLGVARAVDAAVLERLAHLVDGRRLGERRLDPRPGLEVDAEVELLGGEGDCPDREDAPGERKEPFRGAGEVELPRPALAAGAEERRPAEDARASDSPRIACVKSTAVNRETIVPMPSVKANPLTPAVASPKRMNAVSRMITFASTIVAIPLR